ncbi:MAG: hypothetical protein H6834_09215 [Planctomycetes bacterium]|nr:hypothetical protein [Planctomycetota bacterium]
MTTPKIAILGGGPYVARLIDILADTLEREHLAVSLHARRGDRLHVIAEHVRRRLQARGRRWAVTDTPRLEEALDGASLVVLLVRIGGLEARAYDERFPRAHGLVGDEGLAAGGLANGWRTLPALTHIANAVRAHCPGARVVNLMAPLGTTTRCLVDEGLDAFGSCELPQVTRARWFETVAPDATPNDLHFAGFNHLGFFWPASPRGERILETVVRTGLVNEHLVERYGALPLHYVIDVFHPDVAHGLQRSQDPERALALRTLTDRMVAAFRERPGDAREVSALRPTPWFDWALGPIVRASLGGPACDVFVDVRNGDALPMAPPDVFVEWEAHVTDAQVATRPCPARPPAAVREFLAQVGAFEEHAYHACRSRDETHLPRALCALPLELDERTIQALVADVVRGFDRQDENHESVT